MFLFLSSRKTYQNIDSVVLAGIYLWICFRILLFLSPYPSIPFPAYVSLSFTTKNIPKHRLRCSSWYILMDLVLYPSVPFPATKTCITETYVQTYLSCDNLAVQNYSELYTTDYIEGQEISDWWHDTRHWSWDAMMSSFSSAHWGHEISNCPK